MDGLEVCRECGKVEDFVDDVCQGCGWCRGCETISDELRTHVAYGNMDYDVNVCLACEEERDALET